MTSKNQPNTYIGATSTTFKTRFNNQKPSFKNPKYKHQTALANCISKLNIKHTPLWHILQIVNTIVICFFNSCSKYMLHSSNTHNYLACSHRLLHLPCTRTANYCPSAPPTSNISTCTTPISFIYNFYVFSYLF